MGAVPRCLIALRLEYRLPIAVKTRYRGGPFLKPAHVPKVVHPIAIGREHVGDGQFFTIRPYLHRGTDQAAVFIFYLQGIGAGCGDVEIRPGTGASVPMIGHIPWRCLETYHLPLSYTDNRIGDLR